MSYGARPLRLISYVVHTNTMSLQDAETIDIIAHSLEDVPNGIELYIVDDGTISDEVERYTALTRKLGTYIGFVIGDEFFQAYPNTRTDDVLIRVLCKRPPNSAMLEMKAVTPRGDRLNRVPVVFEDMQIFLTGQYTWVSQSSQPDKGGA